MDEKGSFDQEYADSFIEEDANATHTYAAKSNPQSAVSSEKDLDKTEKQRKKLQEAAGTSPKKSARPNTKTPGRKKNGKVISPYASKTVIHHPALVRRKRVEDVMPRHKPQREHKSKSENGETTNLQTPSESNSHSSQTAEPPERGSRTSRPRRLDSPSKLATKNILPASARTHKEHKSRFPPLKKDWVHNTSTTDKSEKRYANVRPPQQPPSKPQSRRANW